MADTIFNKIKNVEITPHVMKTYRTPSLSLVANVSLNGLAYVQSIGPVTYQIQVDFVIHENNDGLLLDAWKNVDLIEIVDEGKTYYGYIIDLKLDHDFANGYHTGAILIQEERIE